VGDVAKPRWCYTDELFDGSFALNNNVAPNNEAAKIAIISNFLTPGVNGVEKDGAFGQVACEAY
jgi:hypothetical protein